MAKSRRRVKVYLLTEMTTSLSLISFPSWFLRGHWLELAGLALVPYVYIAYQRLRYRRRNELFRVVSENAADMIALVEVTGKRLYNSPAYEKVLGYSAKELAATASLDQVHPEESRIDRHPCARASRRRCPGLNSP